jgi:hypothetical protein
MEVVMHTQLEIPIHRATNGQGPTTEPPSRPAMRWLNGQSFSTEDLHRAQTFRRRMRRQQRLLPPHLTTVELAALLRAAEDFLTAPEA